MKKKLLAGALALAMVMTGLVVAQPTAKEAEAAAVTEVVYEAFVEGTYESLIGTAAPVFDGVEPYEGGDIAGWTVDASADYLFGGWYGIDDSGALVKVDETDYESYESGYANNFGASVDNCLFAKWVPSSVAGVKAQNLVGTNAETDKTNTRIISAVDSLDYKEVGFELLTINKETGKETVVKTSGVTTKVYDELVAGEDSYTADQVFGPAAAFFSVINVTNIPNANFDDIVHARPYWVTYDGITVKGLPKYVHVEDQYLGLVNVSITVNELESAVAAGVLEIKYPSDKLAFKYFESGRLFKEMEVADKGTSVRCAGNVENINNNTSLNDIYVNLRFEIKSGASLTFATNDFVIEGDVDFCDNNEEIVTVNVWDVLY